MVEAEPGRDLAQALLEHPSIELVQHGTGNGPLRHSSATSSRKTCSKSRPAGAASTPLRSAPLREPAAALTRLADTADQAGDSRETFDRYALSLDAARKEAAEPGWADGRSFTFQRSLAGGPELVWRHLI